MCSGAVPAGCLGARPRGVPGEVGPTGRGSGIGKGGTLDAPEARQAVVEARRRDLGQAMKGATATGALRTGRERRLRAMLADW